MSEEKVIDLVVENLLLNKSVLFVSDVFTYNSIVFELKESFEDVNLYLFSFSNFDLEIINKIDLDTFDMVVFYLNTLTNKESLVDIVKNNKNILVI